MFSNPSHRHFMIWLNNYYDSPSLQKVKEENGKAIYMCKIRSLLLNEKRYLIAICKSDSYPIGHLSPLNDLIWEFFQARILQDSTFESIIQHSYALKTESNFKMNLVRCTKEFSIYRDEQEKLPIEITLLHTSRIEYEYPRNGTLTSCLETFQTIIGFI